MNFIMIDLLLREALDRLCVGLNIYLVSAYFNHGEWTEEWSSAWLYENWCVLWYFQ